MSQLQIRLLGRFEVARDAARIELPARKSEALLALLALRPGVPFGRERLAALLWPDVPEAQARTSLRQALGHLRSRISEALVVATADEVHLDPASAWVDTAELERLLRRPAAEREPILDVWRGPLLDGFPALTDAVSDWIAEERVRLSERVAERLEECLAALSAAGKLEQALRLGARLIEIEPTRESIHRALMRLEAERGERAQALRRFERCRELLLRHLGVEPAAETRQLRARLCEEPLGEPAPQKPAPAAGESRATLVVLPFEAPSEQSAARLLADGIAEDVTTELSRFPQLAVIARSSIPTDAKRPPDQLAKELGARLLLSGSVRSSGTRSRVTATLADSTTGLQIWAERWEVDHEDLFAALDRLTRSVVTALSLRIDEVRLKESRKRARKDLRAYECWLQGMDQVRRGTAGCDVEARALFEQALAIEPDFARAYAGISLSHFNDWSCSGWERWEERERLSFANARHAVELDQTDHVSQYILGRIHVYRREYEQGRRHLEAALALNPNDTDALVHVAIGLTQLGEPERAVELAQTALRLHPRHPDWYAAAAAIPRFFARELETAVSLMQRAPDGFVDTRAYLAAALGLRGDAAAAAEHLERFLRNFGERIVTDRRPTPGEALRWLLHVNPLQRASDAEYLIEGLVSAGLPRAVSTEAAPSRARAAGG